MRSIALPAVASLALALQPASAAVEPWSPYKQLSSGVRWYVNVWNGTIGSDTTLLGNWTWSLTWTSVPGYQPTLEIGFNTAQGSGAASVAVNASAHMANLAAGSGVGPGTAFSGAGTGSVTATIGTGSGAFSPTGVGYFGFRFRQAGQVHYGWSKLVGGAGGTMTLQQVVYDSTADTTIAVGSLGIPAPGALGAAVLLGGLGKRRRRDLH